MTSKAVTSLVKKALTKVKRNARRRWNHANGVQPTPTYTHAMVSEASGFLCVHRLVRKAVSKAKILAAARERARREDKERVRERDRQFYKRHRDERLERMRLYRKTPAFRESLRHRLLNDPQFLANTRLRRRLHRALEASTGSKQNSTLDLIGCTASELVDHLCADIEDDNLNSKVIDHIFPLKAYDLDDPLQQYMAMHWSNLRATTREENARKHSHLPSMELAARVARWCWPPGVNLTDLQ